MRTPAAPTPPLAATYGPATRCSAPPFETRSLPLRPTRHGTLSPALEFVGLQARANTKTSASLTFDRNERPQGSNGQQERDHDRKPHFREGRPETRHAKVCGRPLLGAVLGPGGRLARPRGAGGHTAPQRGKFTV